MIDKANLIQACDGAFDSKIGRKVEAQILEQIEAFSMNRRIRDGVIVGFSGGADSVLLLIFLRKFQKSISFPLKAIHINHSIRGADADSDEEFCQEFCKTLNIEFESFRIDIPFLASEQKKGLEEVARNERYKALQEALENSDRHNTIATAHNSTDNLETFIFNLMRGAGTAGLCGIPPIRDNIIRPILSVSKEDVLETLSEANIPFVTDKTNFSIEYTRNYIRHEILPKLKKLSASPEASCAKAINNLRVDNEYISSLAYDYYTANVKDGKTEAEKLSALDSALLSRVIRFMVNEKSEASPEKIHIDRIIGLLRQNKNFEVYLPGNISFFCKNKICYIAPEKKNINLKIEERFLNAGLNYIPELDIYISVAESKNEDFSSNVYKFAIQADLQSAIICGRIKIRQKQDGDSYSYGGITRKVKKLFNDKKIPQEDRNKIPILCDDNGIIWIPGFGVRDDKPESKTKKFITIYKKY